MQDILAGYAIMGLISLGGFVAVRAGTRNWSVRGLNGLAMATILVVGLYSIFLWENLLLTEVLPFSNLIILSNIYPLAALVLAAISSNRLRDTGWRRVVPMAGLMAAGVWAMAYPLLGAAPECGVSWDERGFCYQTTQSTCTAASGATLLAAYKIPTTEEEMAELCLTRQGTSWKGFYRGLKLKTAGTPYDVKMAHLTADELAQIDRPVVLRVGKRGWLGSDNAAGLPEGWQPGEIHSVVCLGKVQQYYVVADPNPEIGIEYWTRADLEKLWDGHSVMIVPRDGVAAGQATVNVKQLAAWPRVGARLRH